MSRDYDYIGQNKQAYATLDDANRYGGGCIGKIALAKPVMEPVILPVMEKKNEATHHVEPVPENEATHSHPSDPYADMDDDQLRELVKSKGIRGYGMMGRAKMIKKLSAV